MRINGRAHSLVRKGGVCADLASPGGLQGSPIACTEAAVDVPLLALPHGEPPDKAGVVLLHQLLTAFCAITTKSVLTHFSRVNLNVS